MILRNYCKRYNEVGEEISWDKDSCAWVKRTWRHYGNRKIPNSPCIVDFSSELEYEYDVYGKAKRGIIKLVVSTEGRTGVKRVERYDVPFYPLPAGELSAWMNRIGFEVVEKVEGREDNGLDGYDVYDFLVGAKQTF